MRHDQFDNPTCRRSAQTGGAVVEPSRALVATWAAPNHRFAKRAVDVVTGVVALTDPVVTHQMTITGQTMCVAPVTCFVVPDREPQPRTSRPRERVLRSDRG